MDVNASLGVQQVEINHYQFPMRRATSYEKRIFPTIENLLVGKMTQKLYPRGWQGIHRKFSISPVAKYVIRNIHHDTPMNVKVSQGY